MEQPKDYEEIKDRVEEQFNDARANLKRSTWWRRWKGLSSQRRFAIAGLVVMLAIVLLAKACGA